MTDQVPPDWDPIAARLQHEGPDRKVLGSARLFPNTADNTEAAERESACSPIPSDVRVDFQLRFATTSRPPPGRCFPQPLAERRGGAPMMQPRRDGGSNCASVPRRRDRPLSQTMRYAHE